MRFVDLLSIIRKYWLTLALVILSLLFIAVDIGMTSLPTSYIFIAMIVFALLSLFDKMKEGKEMYRLRREVELSNQRIKEIDKKTSEQIEKFDRIENEKRESIHLLGELINKGLIDQEDVLNHLENPDIFSLSCHATTLPYPKDMDRDKRLYPMVLQKMGFVRMRRYGALFVITGNKLHPDLRDTELLKKYILAKIDESLKEEWKAFLNRLGSDPLYRKKYLRHKKERYDKHLKFSVLLLRGKISKRNIGYLKMPVFGKEFYELINADINLNKVSLPKDKKVKIKKFVLDSSIDLFFYDVKKSDKEKLELLERKLKSELGIKQFSDYLDANNQDITDVFEKSFSPKRSEEFTKLLKRRVYKYTEALKDLGISVY